MDNRFINRKPAPLPPVKLGELPKEQQTAYLAQLSAAVEGAMPAGSAKGGVAFFAMILFDDQDKLHYISNANPAGVAKAFRGIAERLEGIQPEKKEGG